MIIENKTNSGIDDFNFLLGDWHVHNRRLVKRLQDCNEWETFPATQHNQALPGRIGNIDDFVAETWRPRFVGLSLRLYNPRTQLWSIYWLDNQTGGLDFAGTLLPPEWGTFKTVLACSRATKNSTAAPFECATRGRRSPNTAPSGSRRCLRTVGTHGK